MTDTKLKSYADRIDRLEEEKKAIGGDVKDVYTEVKAAGYNTKALRKVLADRRKKTDAQMEADMEIYRAALGELGATYRSVADKLGMTKSKLHRLVPNRKNGTAKADVISPPEVATLPATPPHDPKTGEITDSRVTEDVDGEQAGRGGAIVCRHSVDPLKANEPESEVSLAGEADAPAPITDDLAAEAEELGLTAVVRDLEAKHRPDTRTFDEIAGPRPARLRRVST